jgi:uncharacterized protein (TIGR02246 family)
MKTRVISTWALSLALTVVPFAQSQTGELVSSSLPATRCSVTSDDLAIREIPERWKSAYNAGQAAEVAALYAVDAYYLTQHFVTGIIHGRADIQAYVQRGIDARYRIDSIEVLGTQCSGDFAYAITCYKSTNAGRNDVGVNLVILRKAGDRWMIVAHEAAVPDPATAVQRLREP